jgi:hypothetical protein
LPAVAMTFAAILGIAAPEHAGRRSVK